MARFVFIVVLGVLADPAGLAAWAAMTNVIVSLNTATADDYVSVGGIMNDNSDITMEHLGPLADNGGLTQTHALRTEPHTASRST